MLQCISIIILLKPCSCSHSKLCTTPCKRLFKYFVLITLCCKTKSLRRHCARLWMNKKTGLHDSFWTNIVNSCDCAVEAACLVVLKRSIVFTTFHYYAFIRWFGRPSSLWINSSFKLKKTPQWGQKIYEITTFDLMFLYSYLIHC